MIHWYREFQKLMENQHYPSEISYGDLRDMVIDIHHEPDDFVDGDLDHRLQKFDKYILKQVPLSDINLNQWSHDEDRSDDFSQRPKEDAPPIVFDETEKSLIDGMHRSNAAAKRGDTHILAYVGTKENIDPYWSEEQEEDEDEDY